MKALILMTILSTNLFAQADRMAGTGNGGEGKQAKFAAHINSLLEIQLKLTTFFKKNEKSLKSAF